MIEVYNEKINCCGCSACYNICPKNAISMIDDEEGFSYPVIDENLCIDCGFCQNTCPLLKDDNCKNSQEPEFYVAKHKDIDVLLSSTSGGAFTALSDIILNEGGVIYGVDFDAEFNIIHKRAHTHAQRNSMRFSKYAQSNLNSIFADIKRDLILGKKVLFTGTPCQTAGLKSFIGTGSISSNLYTCDLICHSIPSPLIWSEYRNLLEKEHNSKLEEVYFRTKNVAWCRENSNKGFTYKVQGDDNYYTDDRFYQLFFGEMTIMRPSCEYCPYTDIHRASDITIADYWGIEKYSSEWYDSRGVSVILVSTPKGRELLNKTSSELSFEKRPRSEQLTEQKRLSTPPIYPENRSLFWKDYRKFGFQYISDFLKEKYK